MLLLITLDQHQKTVTLQNAFALIVYIVYHDMYLQPEMFSLFMLPIYATWPFGKTHLYVKRYLVY